VCLLVVYTILAKIQNFNKNEENVKEHFQYETPEIDSLLSLCAADIYNIIEQPGYEPLSNAVYRIIDMMSVDEKIELISCIMDMQAKRMNKKKIFYPASALTLLQIQTNYLYLQSEDINAGSTITDNSNTLVSDNSEQEVIVRYLDESPGAIVAHNKILDTTFHGDYVEDHSISQYLGRPISIQTITWAEGSKLNTTIQPWDLFLNTTQVRKKIDNFARLTCNLHIKVILNASPFYYGAGLISYQPLTNFNTSTISASLTTNGDAHISALSQQPHIWIYPQTNQGGEMVLPFLNYRTWLNIGSRADVQSFGSMTIQSPTNLMNANSVAAANVTLQIYAWATDVKLCAPTSVLALQSGEYGAISGPASSVSKVAKSLSMVPMIGPYARATDMLASGVGALAKLFGFTNAPIVEDVKPFKNLPFHGFASCEISQPIEKLTVDPKNELTIDSRVCGHNGVDELLIKNFVQRESYLLQATWAAAHTTGQVLVRANVTPDTKILETHTVPYIQGNPMSHVNTLFRYWRGDIIYRFRFICSKFHRGRVKIQWDPQSALAAAQDANLIHTQIVDISSDTDVEFRVPYLNNQLFSRNSGRPSDPSTYNTNNIVNTGAITTYDQNLHNGRIVLSVLTQQTSPVTSADIIILVSARAAENMTFAMPQQPPKEVSWFDLQSDEGESASSSNTFNYDQTEHYDLTSKAPVLDDETFSVCMGERITSLRQLLRRTVYHRTALVAATPSATVLTLYNYNHARLPLSFGYDPNGIDTADSTIAPGNNKTFNFVNNTFITWISTCFVGYRGAINWHYNFEDTNYINTAKLSRFIGPTINTTDYVGFNNPSISSRSQYNRANIVNREAGGQGCCLNNTRTQAGVSAQYPQYTIYRMQTPNVNQLVLGSAVDESNNDHCKVEFTAQPHGTTNPCVSSIDFYVSCGTDFNCVFFINVPTIVNYGAVPAAI